MESSNKQELSGIAQCIAARLNDPRFLAFGQRWLLKHPDATVQDIWVAFDEMALSLAEAEMKGRRVMRFEIDQRDAVKYDRICQAANLSLAELVGPQLDPDMLAQYHNVDLSDGVLQ